jgi:hypothetical protein
MTVIVSVKINDGVIMAADSASTFGTGQIYLNADKLVNLVKGLPIGVMVTGAGGIGSESISTLLKDLRQRLDSSVSHARHEWALHSDSYTMEEVAHRVREFLYEEKVAPLNQDCFMRLRICGYSAGRPLAEVWEVIINGKQSPPPTQAQKEDDFGPRWDGEYEALNRLIIGCSTTKLEPALMAELKLKQPEAEELTTRLLPHLYELMALSAMPVQDAIDLARFMVETTIGFTRFSVLRQPKHVGGAVEIAAITKHEGFRWIQRRHFYTAELNP